MKNTKFSKTSSTLFIILVALTSVIFNISCKNPSSPENETPVEKTKQPIFEPIILYNKTMSYQGGFEQVRAELTYYDDNTIDYKWYETFRDNEPEKLMPDDSGSFFYKDGNFSFYKNKECTVYAHKFPDNVNLSNFTGTVRATWEAGDFLGYSYNTLFDYVSTPEELTGTSSSSGSESGSSITAEGSYSIDSTMFAGSFDLKNDGTWVYTGNKSGIATSNGTYTTDGSKITIKWNSAGHDIEETFNITENGSSIKWKLENGSISNFFLMLFGEATKTTLTFSKE